MSVSGNRNAVMVVVRAMGCQCQGQMDRTEPEERDSETQPGQGKPPRAPASDWDTAAGISTANRHLASATNNSQGIQKPGRCRPRAPACVAVHEAIRLFIHDTSWRRRFAIATAGQEGARRCDARASGRAPHGNRLQMQCGLGRRATPLTRPVGP